jgi:hypothetical protein
MALYDVDHSSQVRDNVHLLTLRGMFPIHVFVIVTHHLSIIIICEQQLRAVQACRAHCMCDGVLLDCATKALSSANRKEPFVPVTRKRCLPKERAL